MSMKNGISTYSTLLRVALTAAIEYDGELWNLAVGYDVDEDDKLGLSWTSYSGDANAAGNGEEGWQNAKSWRCS